ncbi:oligosaccharide flippase family protein [Lysobacter korlensis]|uniref:Oligosaccharide flippase family protein n=1 Tax=Lysobacter korlensis TaxID=553636 RepID=A0ABV6RXU4_9GAMM
MTETTGASPGFRRTVLLMTASSFLVPLTGVLTAPILAQGLGVAGRGAAAAALAPSALVVAVATLGLPEALTYYLAKHPRITRPAVGWSAVIASVLGAACFVLVLVALPFLSTGDPELGDLILLATALVIPALVVAIFRGAASGRQMWNAVATERVVNAALRIVVLGALFVLDQLTVFNAVLVTSLAPIIAGVVYWRLWTVPPAGDADQPFAGNVGRALMSFGSRMWIGAVASMVLARVGQIIMAPLSSLAELGLYIVATTISDVPLIVALAVRDALYGVNSRTNDPQQITTTSRISVLIGGAGCLAIGVTLPAWMGPVFGDGFEAAIIPTWMLMVSALLCIPGLMASAGLGAWGRPGLRSLGLTLTLAIYIPVFILLVPLAGAIGAAWTSIVANVVLTTFNVVAASRVMKVPARDFLVLRRSDFVLASSELRRLTRPRRR